jgi:hypothetical protein
MALGLQKVGRVSATEDPCGLRVFGRRSTVAREPVQLVVIDHEKCSARQTRRRPRASQTRRLS